ncbi:hypothetical protein LR48_Vigan543s002300 [Vigna angularis]|uniref:Uncharacterized protein n=1 Tax=Phaseolus angularis TaxID=3914 RepID=A0A0L9TCT1_PHAAN|nr:hypothetical protein LR48_Vigan543s002300 [Vigna angularis]
MPSVAAVPWYSREGSPHRKPFIVTTTPYSLSVLAPNFVKGKLCVVLPHPLPIRSCPQFVLPIVVAQVCLPLPLPFPYVRLDCVGRVQWCSSSALALPLRGWSVNITRVSRAEEGFKGGNGGSGLRFASSGEAVVFVGVQEGEAFAEACGTEAGEGFVGVAGQEVEGRWACDGWGLEEQKLTR